MRRTSFNGGWETRPHASFFLEMVGAARAVAAGHAAARRDARAAPRDPAARSGIRLLPRRRLRVPDDAVTPPRSTATSGCSLEFEGVYRDAMVYVNGALAGHWATGYTGFTVDARRPPAVRRATTRSGSSAAPTRTPAGTPAPASTGRCTSSSAALTHIALDGVRVTTPDVDDEFAVVEVATTVEHDGRGHGRRSTSSPRSGTPTAPSSPPRRRRSPCCPASRPSSGSGSDRPQPGAVEPRLARAVHGGGLPAGRRGRGGRRRRRPSASAPCRSTPSAGCGSTASRSSCAARASTTTTACSARRRSAAPRSAGSSCSRRRASTRCAARTTR